MTEQPRRRDVWVSGALYEPYVGRWSRLVARDFVRWLGVPAGKDWLDVGCGTGAVTQAILDDGRPNSVQGVDLSLGLIAYAKARLSSDRVGFAVGDGQSLPFGTHRLDALVSGLVLNFVPQPDRAIAEMVRVARRGGVAAAYVWDYAGKMELMRYFWDAAMALDPAVSEHDEGRRFPICQPKPLADLFAGAGLHDVEVRPIDTSTDFHDFDDYWFPFLSGQAPAPRYAMSLSEERRAALRDRIRSKLPIRQDGTIHLTARAWAVRGRKP